MYLGVGVSGVALHMVGTGTETIIAINKRRTPESSKWPVTALSAVSSKWFPPWRKKSGKPGLIALRAAFTIPASR